MSDPMSSKFSGRHVAVLATMFCTTAAFAQDNRGTPEQRAACTPDAFRLCSSHLPDPGSVEQCLRQNKSDLSNACRLVFEQGAVAGGTK
jgi:hypothetical protein